MADRPRDVYTRRLQARREALAVRERRHVTLGNLRILAFAAMLAAAVAVFAQGRFSAWWLLAPLAVFVGIGGTLERALRERTRYERAVAFYERALTRLDGRWAGHGEPGTRFADEHHLYTRDLDIFGDASLFELLCAARTRIGEETLAAWLRTPASSAVVRARQEAVDELVPRLDLREDLAVVGEDARVGVDAEALAAWGERPPETASLPPRVVALGLSASGALAIAAFVAYTMAGGGLVQLDVSVLAGLRVYFLAAAIGLIAIFWRFRRQTERMLHEVDEAAHDLALLAGVLRRLETERFAAPRLAALRVQLDVDGRPPSWRIARLKRLRDLVDSRDHVLVRLTSPLLLWDLHLAYVVETWRRTSGPALRRWLNAVGEIEAVSSLAGYAAEHPRDQFPDLTDDSPCFAAEELAHPLIPEDRAVPNDVRLDAGLRVLVVSGSNMSGKSTLLRTVGVNAVLAQAGAPVRARRLRLSPLAVCASIRLQDSLREGTSRFYAEITRLRRIMTLADGALPVLFLIDECLHGTNSHDRRIGAEAVVRGLVERGALGLVTTHDLALAHIAEALAPRGANVHFQDFLEDGRMRFDYRLRPGVVQKSNALELMRSVGLEV
ncbi:MAG: DNA mismatch repair protein MutS [Gemmatimonadetes bacterium]|nr:DNA mismatch repair protein MutS [Gemmatimonadota bacterium]